MRTLLRLLFQDLLAAVADLLRPKQTFPSISLSRSPRWSPMDRTVSSSILRVFGTRSLESSSCCRRLLALGC